ncbi:EndoU domain-containing protein [Massilia endophytica]|uniref:EndoU domain-containing protein n=1 Tax=Massilia endophytica TaxID=2899220 RepID=UPI00389911C3
MLANPVFVAGGAALGAAGAAYLANEISDSLSGTNGGDKPNLLDDKGETHVLDGDATGGGHRPGTGKPGKSEFPSNWSDDKIKGEISDVATDPNSTRTPGRGGRTIVQGTRDGIDITVVVEPDSKGGRIVTGFPTNVPRNPK